MSIHTSLTMQGLILVNNLMYLLYINFTKMDPIKDGKENIMMMMDAFSKSSAAVVTLITTV